MKIKAINYQTSSCQEKILAPEIETLNKCVIGRHPNCDLVLNTPEVSRVPRDDLFLRTTLLLYRFS